MLSDERRSESAARTRYGDNDEEASASESSALLHSRARLWPQIADIVVEAAPTLLLTTVGLLFSGELLDHVSHWDAMRQVDLLIMIIPVVMNLKGNLEMNLTARLGTAANVGELDNPATRKSIIYGNLALLQVQGALVSFVASCVSLLLGLVVPGNNAPAVFTTYRRRPRPSLPPPSSRKSGVATFIMVASTAMTATSLSSLILGCVMCFLVVLCRFLGRDPDNIAPPIATCLGDLITLLLIGYVSDALIHVEHTPAPFLVSILVVLVALWCLVSTRRNPHVRPLLTQGWTPLFGAMIISLAAGIILDLFVGQYKGFALLAVVISGLPGSVGSIFVSRLSTSLHAEEVGAVPSTAKQQHPVSTALAGPSRLYGSIHHTDGDTAQSPRSFSKLQDQHSLDTDPPKPSPRLVMLTLIIVTIPIEIISLGILRKLGWLHLPILFVGFSIVFFCIAVTASLFIAHRLTLYLWSKKLDPDMYAMPIHSALVDLIGQLLLVICFEIVGAMGVRVKVKQKNT